VSLQPQYLQILSGELANEQSQAGIRTAAALALKNAFSAREYARLRQVQERWINLSPEIKQMVKQRALSTLATPSKQVGSAAAQFIASVAAIEVPRNQWPELMPALVESVGQGTDSQKQASLTTIGFICDTDDADLREALGHHSNAILTAVVQGARKEETNNDVRVAAINALSDSIEFVRSNFDNEGERNYIMQVICEATQADDDRIQQGSYGCLNRIMGLYYDKMRFYMEKALFGLTIQGMKSEESDVAKLAVEFWCTVCEEEIAIEDDNTQVRLRLFRPKNDVRLTCSRLKPRAPLSSESTLTLRVSPHRRSFQCCWTCSLNRTRMPTTTSTTPRALPTNVCSFGRSALEVALCRQFSLSSRSLSAQRTGITGTHPYQPLEPSWRAPRRVSLIP
jgi:hypothetical protein